MAAAVFADPDTALRLYTRQGLGVDHQDLPSPPLGGASGVAWVFRLSIRKTPRAVAASRASRAYQGVPSSTRPAALISASTSTAMTIRVIAIRPGHGEVANACWRKPLW